MAWAGDYSPFSLGGIIWCHRCQRPTSHGRPPNRLVCSYCRGDFVEEISYDEAMLQGSQSRPPLSRLFLTSHGEFPHVAPLRIMRGNSGEGLRGPGQEQMLQESLESDSGRRGQRRASKASVEALVVVKVRGKDAAVECTVCKDEFKLGEYVKQMPCSHLYHVDCILQWLAEHNTCPLCRYEMPTEDAEYDRMHSRSRNETPSSGGRPSFSHTGPFRAFMTMSGQAQGETSSDPSSSRLSASGFSDDRRGNSFDLDSDGDVEMKDAWD